MAPHDLHIVRIEDQPAGLGRQVVHDPRSRAFPLEIPVDPATWQTKALRSWDPRPNPNQPRGNCTGVQKCVGFNTAGHRVKGRVLTMADADRCYSIATGLDPWPGSWPPEDTGSSGLAAAKAAQQLGWGGQYLWLFGGADQVVQAIMDGWPVGVGAWWTEGMFQRNAQGIIEPTGKKVGGHQWSARAYDKRRDLIGGRCWWGGYRDFFIRREHLADLLAEDGDAHVQDVAQPALE